MKPIHLSDQAVGMACRCDGCSKPAAHEKDADLARRDFLCSAVAGTAMVLAGGYVHARSAGIGPEHIDAGGGAPGIDGRQPALCQRTAPVPQ